MTSCSVPSRSQTLPAGAPASSAPTTTSGKELFSAVTAPVRVAHSKKRRQRRASAKDNAKARKTAEQREESALHHQERLSGLLETARAHAADKQSRLVAADLQISDFKVEVAALKYAREQAAKDLADTLRQLEDERRRHKAEEAALKLQLEGEQLRHAAAESTLAARYASLVNTSQASHLEHVHIATDTSSKTVTELRGLLDAAQGSQERLRQERDDARAAIGRQFGPCEARLRAERDSAKREAAALRLELGVAKQSLLQRDLEIRELREQARSVFPGRD